MHFRFVTSTPLDISRGSGTFAGIAGLAKCLRQSGETVDLITPTFRFPVYTVERLLFNEMLRLDRRSDNRVTVGFDMDGYTLASRGGPHIAAIKGVIADEMRFESGLTKATMRLQALCEKLHVHRSDLVIATSRYSSERIQEFYGVASEPRIVPEPIDLVRWNALLQENPASPPDDKFIVLCVCRFYPRKRLQILLAAADYLRAKIPGLEVRIVGDGPEAGRLKAFYRRKNLQGIVQWLGCVSRSDLAREYNRCHIFCLPSLQEGFGIVFLEAMASAKPIVAARTAAVPEVVRHGILVEPDSDEALAQGIERLYQDSALQASLAAEGLAFVRQFDASIVADSFLRQIDLVAGIHAAPHRA
jgi:glycosyltransferase involved in cell wall biosynthesis